MTKNIERVRELLEQGADPNEVDNWNRTPLFMVWKSLEIARLLVQAGADVNQIDKDGETPLWKAVRNGFPEIVNLYLENGANPNHTLPNGLSLIEYTDSQLSKYLSMNEKQNYTIIKNLLDKAMRPSTERSVAEVLSAPRNPQGWVNMLRYKSYPASMSNVTREQRRNKGLVRTLKSEEKSMNNILRASKKSLNNLRRGKYANRSANEAAGIPGEIGVKISNFLTPRKQINIRREKWEREERERAERERVARERGAMEQENMEARERGLAGGRKKTRKLRKSKY